MTPGEVWAFLVVLVALGLVILMCGAWVKARRDAVTARAQRDQVLWQRDLLSDTFALTSGQLHELIHAVGDINHVTNEDQLLMWKESMQNLLNRHEVETNAMAAAKAAALEAHRRPQGTATANP